MKTRIEIEEIILNSEEEPNEMPLKNVFRTVQIVFGISREEEEEALRMNVLCE